VTPPTASTVSSRVTTTTTRTRRRIRTSLVSLS
jgi:hypothetical protein